jgi:hypothetical protein
MIKIASVELEIGAKGGSASFAPLGNGQTRLLPINATTALRASGPMKVVHRVKNVKMGIHPMLLKVGASLTVLIRKFVDSKTRQTRHHSKVSNLSFFCSFYSTLFSSFFDKITKWQRSRIWCG